MSTELAWAAGFFDGEGHIRCQKTKRHWELKLDIAQINPEPLFRFKAAVGGGVVYGPYKGKTKNSKPYWRYTATSFCHTEGIVKQLRPFLCSIKQKQSAEAFNKWNNRPLKREKCRKNKESKLANLNDLGL